jgi:hypothetical protein
MSAFPVVSYSDPSPRRITANGCWVAYTPWKRVRFTRGLGHQGGQPGDEVQRLQNDVGGAVPVRGLECIAHIPLAGQVQPGYS